MKLVVLTTNPDIYAPLVFRTKDNQVHQRQYYGAPMVKMGDRPAHVHVLSDETPQEGDWCFNSYDNSVWKYKPTPCPMPYWGNLDTLTKIVASTNSNYNLPEVDTDTLNKLCSGSAVKEIEWEFFLKHTE